MILENNLKFTLSSYIIIINLHNIFVLCIIHDEGMAIKTYTNFHKAMK